MKAISIRQPWAWLILNASKDIENRSRPTKKRERILIHASKTVDDSAWDKIRPMFDRDIRWIMMGNLRKMVTLPGFTGGIVGAVTIVDCVTVSDSLWFEGPYGWVLSGATQLPFVPYKGTLSFFDVDDAWLRHQLSEPEARATILAKV
jgi:hypothetical protein